jgi:hypothetical protein
MGELDISPALYERMTWREFEYKARGYFLRLARHKWMMREIIWNMWATKGDDIERREIMILPWDAPDDAGNSRKELAPEELEEIDRRFSKVHGKMSKEIQ